jgi:hypothetical protein
MVARVCVGAAWSDGGGEQLSNSRGGAGGRRVKCLGQRQSQTPRQGQGDGADCPMASGCAGGNWRRRSRLLAGPNAGRSGRTCWWTPLSLSCFWLVFRASLARLP